MRDTGKGTAVLIVAGGSGSRMGSLVPKQLLPLAGKPVLVHTIERFRGALPDADIYLALAPELYPEWECIAREHGLTGVCRICRGGKTRFETVKNSLAVITPCEIVLVHDAVRALVPAGVITGVLNAAREWGAAIPVIRVADSLRAVDCGGGSAPVDRERLRAVQTPQGFGYDILVEAYRAPYRESFTDDAQVVEAAGHKVLLSEGSPLNIKLTYPEDMAVAEAILSAGQNK